MLFMIRYYYRQFIIKHKLATSHQVKKKEYQKKKDEKLPQTPLWTSKEPPRNSRNQKMRKVYI